MTDIPADSVGSPDDAGEPVRVLSELREEPSDRFLGNVLDVINTRQTSSQAVELMSWGVGKLVLELFESFLGALGLRDSRHDGE